MKLVVFGADGHEVAAMFVQGSVRYDEEAATFIAVTEDGHTAGELFVDDTVAYDENTDAFVIRTAGAELGDGTSVAGRLPRLRRMVRRRLHHFPRLERLLE